MKAIVADENSTPSIVEPDNGHATTFDWSESMQGVILGAYYYGYIVTNVNAGQLAEWLGVKWLLSGAMIISAVLSLVAPSSAYISGTALVAVRFLTGLAQVINNFPAEFSGAPQRVVRIVLTRALCRE